MAKIHEETITIVLSTIIRDGVDGPELVTQEHLATIQTAVEAVLDNPAVIVEIQ
jgi:hypothetical protein